MLNPLIHTPDRAHAFGVLIGEWFRDGVLGNGEVSQITNIGVMGDLADALRDGAIDQDVHDTLWQSYINGKNAGMLG